MLNHGIGVSVDYKEAARYYKLAADQGNLPGMSNYGVCLEMGCGVPMDKAEALKYYRRAADDGNKEAKRNLT